MSVNDSINELIATLQSSSFYAPWYRIVIGDNDLVLCTNDPNNNYVVSFENKKNGSGLCNSFTIIIAWRPQLNQDINYMDKILAKAGLQADMTKFSLQYGYAMTKQGSPLLSPVYNGMITKYGVEIRNGFLMYTLNGYSSIASLNDKTIQINLEDTGLQKPTEVVRDVFTRVMNDLVDEDKKYEFMDPDNVVGSDNAVDIAAAGLSQSRTTLMQWVTNMLNIAVDSSQSNATDATEKYVYTFEIKDSEPTKQFIIHKVSASDGNPSADEVNAVFDWLDCTSSRNDFNLITEFRPEFDGTVSMAYQKQQDSATPSVVLSANGITIDNESVLTSNDLTTADQAKNDEASYEKNWADLIRDYSYKAQMSTIGIPYDIPILTKFKIRPLINNQEHLTAGTYAVLSSYDRLDSSGFSSSFELFRMRNDTDD